MGFCEVTSAHSDCDTVCNFLFDYNFVMLYMTMSKLIDYAMNDRFGSILTVVEGRDSFFHSFIH